METSFSVYTKVQDIKIILNEINAFADGNRKHLNIPVEFTFRQIDPQTTFDLASIKSTLALASPITLIADTTTDLAFNMRKGETTFKAYWIFRTNRPLSIAAN